MTLIRALLASTCLVLLGIALYCYHNLTALVEFAAQHYLSPYGVEQVSVDELRVSRDQLNASGIALQGVAEGTRFSVKLESLDLLDYQQLLRGATQPAISVGPTYIELERLAVQTEPSDTPVELQDFAPRQLIESIPVAFVEMAQWQLDYLAPDSPPLSAGGSLQLRDTNLDLTLTATHLDTILQADISSHSGASPAVIRASLAGNAATYADITASLKATTGSQWHWELSGDLQYSPLLELTRQLIGLDIIALEPDVLAPLSLTGGGSLRGDITHGTTLASSHSSNFLSGMQVNAELVLRNEITDLDYTALAADINGTVDLQLALDSEQLLLTLAPGQLDGLISPQYIGLSAETRGALGWEQLVPLQWASSQPITVTVSAQDSYSLQGSAIVLRLGNMKSGATARLQVLSVESDSKQLTPLHVQITGRLESSLQRQTLPAVAVELAWLGSAAAGEVNLQLQDIAESFKASLAGQLALDSGKGKYRLDIASNDLPYAVATAQPLLRHFKILEQEVLINSGKLSLRSDISSDGFDVDSLRQQAHFHLENVAGQFEDYAFDRLNLQMQWTGIDQWKTVQPATITVGHLDVGFSITNIAARLTLPKATPVLKPSAIIEQFSAQLFGGSIRLPEGQTWDFAADSNSTIAHVEQWQLGELVALQQDQNIRALGVLSGEIPLTVSGGRILIEKGYLEALPPGGHIRYGADAAGQALAASNAELGLAMQYLSNFQYKQMGSKVELDKDGNLLLGMSLAGSNPDYYSGQEIQFNINLEQNIDPLLQSLRISDNLQQQLEGGLK